MNQTLSTLISQFKFEKSIDPFSLSMTQQYKVEVYQQQIDMEKLCHQGELLLRKVNDQTDRDMIQEPLTELRHLWDNLVDKITIRQVWK